VDLKPTIKALRDELRRIDQAILAFEQIAAGDRPRRGRPRKVPIPDPASEGRLKAKSVAGTEES
jgi:hypothetical protein